MLQILKNKPSIILKAQEAKFNPGLPLQMLIFVAVFIVSQMITGVAAGGVFIVTKIGAILDGSLDLRAIASDPSIVLLSLYFTVLATISVIIYCRFIERRSLYSMGFVKKQALFHYLKGLLIGFVMFGMCVLIAYMTGALEYEGFAVGASAFMIVIFFFGFFFQGMSEEVMLRGYLMITIATKKSILFAIVLNSVLFSLFHMLNTGITPLAVLNLILFGVFASLYTLKTNNIWGISAIHTVWNFVQGNVFGIRVSGINTADSVFSFVPTEGASLINGGSFGLEGGLAVTIVLVVSSLVVVFLKEKTSNQEDEIVVEK